ncbi:hypothetical protein ACOME3_005577 [Neoechinorhynchus agilis]
MNNRSRMMAFWDIIHPMMADSKSLDKILMEASNLSDEDHETSIESILPRLLSEEMLMQEVRVRKVALLRFLSRPEVIRALVDNVFHDGSDSNIYKTSYEILNCPDENMMDVIVHNGAIEKMVSFLKTPCDTTQMKLPISRVCHLLTVYIHNSTMDCFDAFDRCDSFNEFIDACCGSGHLSGNEHVHNLLVKGFLRPEGIRTPVFGGTSSVFDALSSILGVTDDASNNCNDEADHYSTSGDGVLRSKYYSLLSKQDFIDRLAFQLLETKKYAELTQTNVAEILALIAAHHAKVSSENGPSVLYSDLCGWIDTFIAEAFSLFTSDDEVIRPNTHTSARKFV